MIIKSYYQIRKVKTEFLNSMNKKLNRRLTDLITELLPPNINISAYLTEALHISKEAAYRRLRGDVHFALYEIVELATKLHFSLDQLLESDKSGGASINLDLIKAPDILPSYNETLSRYRTIFKLIKDDPESTLYSATNMLSFYFYAHKENLTKFRICRWLHQTNKLKSNVSLKDIDIPQDVFDLHVKVANELNNISKIIFIWDVNIFKSITYEIKYFYELKLLTKQDVRNIKKELLDILKQIERILSDAQFNERNDIQIYLCNISMETSYILIESARFELSMIRVFAINLIETKHPDICQLQKDWIYSLRRYSTLITQSNEIDRTRFINKQRSYINSL